MTNFAPSFLYEEVMDAFNILQHYFTYAECMLIEYGFRQVWMKMKRK